ncbi:MAG: hypothetical protein QOC62_3519 [Mycobacterium sp.]|jgi:SDR family mycofactocin-dependent oxidoreductase|nr:hypothetical protein [Mycobacterium sp.]
MARLSGKVAFVTGAARGQGRSHAVKMACEGADIIAIDICAQIDSVGYAMSSVGDLDETVRLVEAEGRRIIARQADVRNSNSIESVVREGLAELGHLDIVLANAGIMPIVGKEAQQIDAWHDAIDVMLSGVFNTVEACLPALLANSNGSSIVLTSSTAGLKGMLRQREGMSSGFAGYHAAKFGVVGLMKYYSNALGQSNVRVNSVHPTGVNTPMSVNDEVRDLVEEFPAIWAENALPIDMVEPEDISNAIIWLCSDDARYVTGVSLPVDAGVAYR